VNPFDAAVDALRMDDLFTHISALSQQEQEILALRFGIGGRQPLTLEEVGRVFGITRERVRQMEARALSKLRHPSTPHRLREPISA
jgi:RNA polymerase primary sigma factor